MGMFVDKYSSIRTCRPSCHYRSHCMRLHSLAYLTTRSRLEISSLLKDYCATEQKRECTRSQRDCADIEICGVRLASSTFTW